MKYWMCLVVGLSLGCPCGTLAIDTNLINFTNRSGWVSNALPVRIEASKLVYRTESGGGVIYLKDLPEDLQRRFGYDPARAAADALADKTNGQRLAATLLAARTEAAHQEADQKRIKEVRAGTRIIYARVIQRLGNRLLVDASGSGKDGHYYVETPEFKKFIEGKGNHLLLPSASGTILLEDYPRAEGLADDDEFITIGYPIGTYSYAAVSGGSKTVRKYTWSLPRAVLLYEPAD